LGITALDTIRGGRVAPPIEATISVDPGAATESTVGASVSVWLAATESIIAASVPVWAAAVCVLAWSTVDASAPI
jgi:predicted phosphoribosyltransferase